MNIGAVEAGGTKIVCGIGNENGEVLDRISFPTEAPGKTLERIVGYFRDKRAVAIGYGSFGPIDIDRESPTYGYVTTTPKPGWANYPMLPELKRALNVPVGWDTDVNAAALGEATWGAAKGLDSCVYYTIGTGVGVGVFAEGRMVHGLVHPEGGHVPTRRHRDDTFAGHCPYHGDCLEGMAAGPAIEARWKIKGSELPADHPAWEIEAFYIGQALVSAILLLSPKKIILGGGVMHQSQLFPLIREHVRKTLNGYVVSPALEPGGIDGYIVPPGLGDNAGLRGAIALGLRTYRESQK
ncbi:ROK family protein [Paenibacillaceae bacterium WGS1546]|uniref:ROK family protein n=1 Tax=Cohnella sp. WGS1546 TaxID=3366810 RepID=UPI00372D2DDE